MENVQYTDWFAHYGVKGQKWGVRRYQNYDGSLTAAGREHYGYGKKRKAEYGKGKGDGGGVYVPRTFTGYKYISKDPKAQSFYDDQSYQHARAVTDSTALKNLSDTAWTAKGNLGSLGDAVDNIERNNLIARYQAEAQDISNVQLLNAMVDRMNAENRYAEAKAQYTQKGKTTVGDMLKIVGGVAAAVGTGAAIYSMVKKNKAEKIDLKTLKKATYGGQNNEANAPKKTKWFNEDGTLNDKGYRHYAKALTKTNQKLASTERVLNKKYDKQISGLSKIAGIVQNTSGGVGVGATLAAAGMLPASLAGGVAAGALTGYAMGALTGKIINTGTKALAQKEKELAQVKLTDINQILENDRNRRYLLSQNKITNSNYASNKTIKHNDNKTNWFAHAEVV